MLVGKNLNLFLMDGEVTGRIKCTMSNWTGLSFKIPSLYLHKCKDREDLKQSCIYFLLNKDENNNYMVYIGQAGIRSNGESLLQRLQEHKLNNKEFIDVIVLTSQNNFLGNTEISYLENRFINLSKEVGRYIVENKNEHNKGNVTEEKQAELEEFIEYSKVVLGMLDFKLLIPLTKDENNEELLLYFTRKSRNKNEKYIDARCKMTSEGFVVFKGSIVNQKENKAISKNLKRIREEYIENEYIKNNELLKDILFSSPSYAASFVSGGSENGRAVWKTKEGLSLNDIND